MPNNNYFPPAPMPPTNAGPGFLERNAPFFLNLGAGLMGGRTAAEQWAGGAQGAAAGIEAIRGQRDSAAKRKAEAALLRGLSPEIADAYEVGDMEFGKAYEMARESRMAKTPKRSWQELPDGTYGYFNENEGTFNPLGKAVSGKVDDFTQRQMNAERAGLKPEDPAYQAYLLTGKMPREDQAPLTATDKKAILEADEMALASQQALPLLDRAMELNRKAYDGPTAGLRGMVTGNFGNEAGQATIELENVVQTQALAQLKAIFGAAPTEGERKILLDIAGSVGQPAPIREAIFKRAKQAAELRLNFYQQRANELRGGTFYQQGPGQQQMAPTGPASVAPSGGVSNWQDYFGGQ